VRGEVLVVPDKVAEPEVFVTRLTRRTLTHAFERALEDAFEVSDGHAGLGPVEHSGSGHTFQATLGTIPEVEAAGTSDRVSARAAAYRGEEDELPPAPARAPDAAHATREKKIAPSSKENPQRPARLHELRRAGEALRVALLGSPSADELKRLRRQFALLNHPDRLPKELRHAAAEVMAVANARIDRALIGKGKV
jgi:hypothetical protein